MAEKQQDTSVTALGMTAAQAVDRIEAAARPRPHDRRLHARGLRNPVAALASVLCYCTTMGTVPVTPLTVTLMVATPAATACTWPVLLTVATVASLVA